MRQPDNLPAVQQTYIGFAGGFDTVTPPLDVPPGFVRSAQNFEIDINGGYNTTWGYERKDGQAAPSDATYSILTCTITGTVNIGDVLTDNAATSYGTVIALPSGKAVLTKVTGVFATGNIKVGATVVGTCTGPVAVGGATSQLLHAQYTNLAADVYRALIAAVPGSGAILGLGWLNDVLYAWRNNAGASAAVMYKTTSSGWSAVSLGRELAYTSGGTYVVAVGDTITGATSGATAVVTGVALASGTWAAGTAAGRFTFASQTGTFQAENLNVGANLNVATIAGNSSAISFAVPSGRFKCIVENFGGGATTAKMYGCDGKNRAFEFDGTTLIPIATGMTTDTPHQIWAHKNQLFLAFAGSAQHSGPGTPFAWSVVSGAGELAVGDTITGFMSEPGSTNSGALGIYSPNRICILYGTGSSDWNLTTYKDQNAGAIANSVQRMTDTVMFDHRGITTLAASQNFGNFSAATLSRRVHTWLTDKRTKTTDSCIARNKSQYRLFFNDGYALYCTFDNNKLLGMMPVLFPNVVRNCLSVEMNDGSEAIFFGSDDGMVYQMEKGTSHDGAAINAHLTLAWANIKSPGILKSFKRVSFEVSGSGYAEFTFGYSLGYSSAEISQPSEVTATPNLTGSTWDSGVSWDQAGVVWDGQTLAPSRCDMPGNAENVSLSIRSNSDYFAPLKFSGALIDYIPRRRVR